MTSWWAAVGLPSDSIRGGEAMCRILIHRARLKSAEKRGGRRARVDLDQVEIASDADDDTLVLVNESLDKLAKEDASAAEIVKLRFFGGLSLEEAGQVLGVTEGTAKRYWAFARAWLFNDMRQILRHCPLPLSCFSGALRIGRYSQ